MHIISKYRALVMGILLGGVGGYMYYQFIGCSTGSCPITSQPINSTLYGAMMGGILFSTFKKQEKRNDGND